MSVSSRDLWRHRSFSKTIINSGLVAVGFPWLGRAHQLFRVVLGVYYENFPYWKVISICANQRSVLITKLMQCWIMAKNNFGLSSIFYDDKFYKQGHFYQENGFPVWYNCLGHALTVLINDDLKWNVHMQITHKISHAVTQLTCSLFDRIADTGWFKCTQNMNTIPAPFFSKEDFHHFIIITFIFAKVHWGFSL